VAADGLQICGYRQGTEQSAARADVLGLWTVLRVIVMMGCVKRSNNWRNKSYVLRATMTHIGVMHGRVIKRGILLRNMRNTMTLVTVLVAPLMLAALMRSNLAAIG